MRVLKLGSSIAMLRNSRVASPVFFPRRTYRHVAVVANRANDIIVIWGSALFALWRVAG
jgi:hypothetical protein